MIKGSIPYFKVDEVVMCNILSKRCPKLEERSCFMSLMLKYRGFNVLLAL